MVDLRLEGGLAAADEARLIKEQAQQANPSQKTADVAPNLARVTIGGLRDGDGGHRNGSSIDPTASDLRLK